MKREFLKGLEISDELIDKIMDEHGKSVEQYKDTAKNVDTLNQQITDLKGRLSEANKQIKEFKDMDVDGIQQAAAEWEAKAKQAEKDSEAKIQKLEFDHALEKALTAAKARNTKAVQALLNMDELEFKDGAIVNLDKQLEGIKKENNYLFEAEAEKPFFSAKTVNTAPNPEGDSFLSHFRMGAGIKNKE